MSTNEPAAHPRLWSVAWWVNGAPPSIPALLILLAPPTPHTTHPVSPFACLRADDVLCRSAEGRLGFCRK